MIVVTFTRDHTFTGYARCYNFSGFFRADSDWNLRVYDVRFMQKRCVQDPDRLRDALHEGLQAATHYRFEDGILRIAGPEERYLLLFRRLVENLVGGTGTIRYLDLEGGFFGLVADDGTAYYPLHLDAAFRLDGLRIRFVARLRRGAMATRMWGRPVEILAIERESVPVEMIPRRAYLRSTAKPGYGFAGGRARY